MVCLLWQGGGDGWFKKCDGRRERERVWIILFYWIIYIILMS